MGQRTVDIGAGQRKIIDERPEPGKSGVFDPSGQPMLASLPSRRPTTPVSQPNPLTMMPGLMNNLQARLNDPNLSEQQKMVILMMMKGQGQ